MRGAIPSIPNTPSWQVVDWIHLAQDKYQWRDILNTKMDFRGP
jgi:hypothetical protein